MNRTLRTLVAAGLVTGVGGGVLAGCADNNSTLFIFGVLKNQGAPNCTFLADPTQPMLLNGILDISERVTYEAVMLVGNQYSPRGQKQNLKTETTRVNLRGAEISLTNSQGQTLQSFSIGGSGFVDSNTGDTPGWGVFAAELIPASVGKTLQSTLLGKGLGAVETVYSSTRVFGDSLGNQSEESGSLTFPIEVCNGCLIQYPSIAITAVKGGGNQCIASTDSAPTSPCIPGQDDPLDCRSCSSKSVTCLCGGDPDCVALNCGSDTACNTSNLPAP